MSWFIRSFAWLASIALILTVGLADAAPRAKTWMDYDPWVRDQNGVVADGIDLPGNDISVEALDAYALTGGHHRWADCSSRCTMARGCVAWTYVKQSTYTTGPNAGPKAHCWLKSRIGSMQANPNTISGKIGFNIHAGKLNN